MARQLKIIEGEGAGESVTEDPNNVNSDPVPGESYTFHGKNDPPDDESDGWEFRKVKEVHRKNGKIIFKDEESQAVIEEEQK